jgi:hypothetical protein
MEKSQNKSINLFFHDKNLKTKTADVDTNVIFYIAKIHSMGRNFFGTFFRVGGIKVFPSFLLERE